MDFSRTLPGAMAGLLCVAFPLLSTAQEPAPRPQADVQQAQAAFDRRFDEYKQAIRTIEQLRSDYQTADPATRERINRDLAQQVAATQTLVDAMVTAAMTLYEIDPQADQRAAGLLLAVAKHRTVGRQTPGGQFDGGDQYEAALPLIKLLIDGGAKDPNLPIWGFLSAFATADYVLAEHYLELAHARDASAAPSPGDGADTLAMEKVEKLAPLLDEYRRLWAEETALREAEAQADDLPRVRLETTKGEIVLELFENEAPQTVANFITLVKQGFYDGLTFHRVLPLFMAQGGDPVGDGTGGPGYAIRCECYEPDARHHFRGSLSMAHSGRDTGGSQFFITFLPAPHLDGLHTVFGRVIEGLDVLGQLQKRQPVRQPGDTGRVPDPDRILSATVLRDRGHAYEFERLPE